MVKILTHQIYPNLVSELSCTLGGMAHGIYLITPLALGFLHCMYNVCLYVCLGFVEPLLPIYSYLYNIHRRYLCGLLLSLSYKMAAYLRQNFLHRATYHKPLCRVLRSVGMPDRFRSGTWISCLSKLDKLGCSTFRALYLVICFSLSYGNRTKLVRALKHLIVLALSFRNRIYNSRSGDACLSRDQFQERQDDETFYRLGYVFCDLPFYLFTAFYLIGQGEVFGCEN